MNFGSQQPNNRSSHNNNHSYILIMIEDMGKSNAEIDLWPHIPSSTSCWLDEIPRVPLYSVIPKSHCCATTAFVAAPIVVSHSDTLR